MEPKYFVQNNFFANFVGVEIFLINFMDQVFSGPIFLVDFFERLFFRPIFFVAILFWPIFWGSRFFWIEVFQPSLWDQGKRQKKLAPEKFLTSTKLTKNVGPERIWSKKWARRFLNKKFFYLKLVPKKHGRRNGFKKF